MKLTFIEIKLEVKRKPYDEVIWGDKFNCLMQRFTVRGPHVEFVQPAEGRDLSVSGNWTRKN